MFWILQGSPTMSDRKFRFTKSHVATTLQFGFQRSCVHVFDEKVRAGAELYIQWLAGGFDIGDFEEIKRAHLLHFDIKSLFDGIADNGESGDVDSACARVKGGIIRYYNTAEQTKKIK
jgi:hypothetical protein